MIAGWEWLEIAAQFGTVVTALAVILALLQLTQGRAAKHRDFENIYVQRYWSLMDGFEGNAWTAKSLQQLSTRDQIRVEMYLQLCEDEIDLRRNGFVSTKTWQIWVDGMKSQCARKAYKDALDAMEPIELPELRYFLKNHDEDPLNMSRLQKWWSGIGNSSRKKVANSPVTAVVDGRQPVA